MNLAIYGSEDPSTLWDLVDTYFTSVSSTNGSPATYNETAFPPPFTGKLIHYLPEANINTLTMIWQTPSLQNYPRNAVDTFLTRYLGHEGEGSLLSHLKARNFASELSSGIEVDADSFYLFSVQITLTEQGLGNVSDVVQAVFKYAYLLANMTEGQFEEMWCDYVEVNKVVFDYAEKKSPEEYTE